MDCNRPVYIMIKLKIALALCVQLLLAACTSPFVRTTTTTFYAAGHEQRGPIYVTAADQNVVSMLEFEHYKRKFEQNLMAVGYTPVTELASAQFVALVAYGIDNGKSAIVSAPIFGQSGGGVANTYGSVGGATFSATTYTMPTYGVVGSSASSVTEYTRAVALDILDAESVRQGKPKKIYELRAKSSGSCSVISGVFNEMLTSMFKGFPGESGKTRMVEVAWPGQC